MRTLPTAFALLTSVSSAAALSAQTPTENAADNPDHFEKLKSCQTVSDDSARLACFDEAVGSIVNASDAGEVQVLDQQDVEKTRRSLFGFSLPDLDIFNGGDKAEESDEDKKKRQNLLETTITSVHYSKSDEVYFNTPEGATWRMSNIPDRLRKIEVGQTVVFKRASLGSFFIRINGQLGVKGRRVR